MTLIGNGDDTYASSTIDTSGGSTVPDINGMLYINNNSAQYNSGGISSQLGNNVDGVSQSGILYNPPNAQPNFIVTNDTFDLNGSDFLIPGTNDLGFGDYGTPDSITPESSDIGYDQPVQSAPKNNTTFILLIGVAVIAYLLWKK